MSKIHYPAPRTAEQQQEMRDAEHAEHIQRLRDEHDQEDEYFNRLFWWCLEWSGGPINLPTKIDFHPLQWQGTQAQMDEIWVKYLKGREDQFKIREFHKFDTFKELQQKIKLIF